MKIKTIVFSLICVFFLSSCTLMMWGHSMHSDTTKVHKENDELIAFGKSKDNQQLVIMGKRYWYFILKEDSEKLYNVLTADLSQRYLIIDQHNSIKPALNVVLVNTPRFRTDICLSYPFDTIPKHLQQKEKNILDKLDFKPQKIGNITSYQTCLGYIGGDIYKKPTDFHLDTQFKIPVPINLLEEKTNYRVKRGKDLVEAIALTPVTLVGDIILLPLIGLQVLTSEN